MRKRKRVHSPNLANCTFKPLLTTHVSVISYKYLTIIIMAEQLTKEHFDQTLTTLYKKFDVKIDEQTKELKAFAVEQADAVGRIITNAALEDRKFLEEKLDVRQRVEKLEKNIEEIRGALHLSTS